MMRSFVGYSTETLAAIPHGSSCVRKIYSRFIKANGGTDYFFITCRDFFDHVLSDIGAGLYFGQEHL